MKNIINVSNEVNSNTGDFVRVGFIKTQKNFDELYDKLNTLNDECLLNLLFIPCETNE